VLFKALLSAVSHLHQKGIIHRDVKGDNILVSKSGLCYLCDFGVSSSLNERRRSMNGTQLYMAPEMQL